ncbi:AraC family transcriptional regulator [Hwanghaeella sp.]|uniref:AraC family transcriptional regulator n=1 Tax=Hwanghaeella sp. TaxID=2605943 RepID=UPI003CCBE231
MLNDYRALISADAEETKKFLAARDMVLAASGDPHDRDAPFHAEINIFETDDFRIAYVQSGSELHVDFSEDCYRYRMLVPLHGDMGVAFPDRSHPCTRERTVIVSPGVPHKMWAKRGAMLLFISFSVAAVRKRFAALTGAPAMEEVIFDQELDLGAGAGSMVLQAVRLIVEEIDAGGVSLSDPWRLAHFEETVLSSLLLYHPHSHRDQLRQQRTSPASKDVRAVIAHIDSNLEAPVRLADLVHVAGVSQSSLNNNFRAFTGMSPMAYLRQARLIAVRQAFLSGDAESVTACAMRYGFTHMGRFSSAYAKAFGETPSKTLTNGRR